MIRKVPVLKKHTKLDIGCGAKTMESYIGMDVRDCGQEIVWDARQGIPFPDNSVDDIRTSHFLEHLDDDQSIDFLQDSLRVLKQGGHMYNRLPCSYNPTAFYFGHKSFWNEYKIDSMIRLTEPMPPFKITKNEIVGAELLFTLEKL